MTTNPPVYQQPWGMVPPQQPRKGHALRNWLIAIGVFALVFLVSCVALIGKAANDVVTDNQNAKTDVTVQSCTTDKDTGWPQAGLMVHNSASTAKQYFITVAFNDAAGNQIDTGNTAVQDLAPGQTSFVTVSALTDGTPSKCVVTDVSRF
jgi:hypothetical protein